MKSKRELTLAIAALAPFMADAKWPAISERSEPEPDPEREAMAQSKRDRKAARRLAEAAKQKGSTP